MGPSDGMAPKSGALARWELVGKKEQQESCLAIKLLQSLYDRQPIWQRYQSGSLEIHSHIAVRGVNLCVPFIASGEDAVFGECHEAIESEVHIYRHKFPVLVGVRQVAENARPFASAIRLKLANNCGVFVADTFEAGMPMRREALLRILNRKLRTVLPGAGVGRRQDIDQVVQRRQQVVDELTNTQARAIAERVKDPWS